MADVFICNSREDRDFAEVVQAKLERAGHTTSMDLDLLGAGEQWQEVLDDAIRRSQAVVVVMTPAARQSEHVAYEWAFALGAGVTVIPLELQPTSFSLRLDALHRLNFCNGVRPWDTLLNEVRKAEAMRPHTSIAIEAGAPPIVTKAARSIDSPDPEERIAAIHTLAQTDHPVAREALLRALQHPVKDVRIEAARLFPDETEPRIVPGLLAALEENWDKYIELVRMRIGSIGHAAVPYLLDALDSKVRWYVLAALGKLGDPSIVPVLTEVLRNPNDDGRHLAAKALGQIGDPGAAPALLAALEDEKSSVRCAAAESLGSLKIAAAVPALVTMLDEDGREARQAAARALGEIGDPTAVPALIQALADHERSVSSAAVVALGRIGDPSPIPELRPLLQESEIGHIYELDLAVMEALARLGDRESFGLIEEKLVRFRGGFGGVEHVCEALLKCEKEGIALLIRVLQNAAFRGIREDAARALRRIDKPEVSAALKEWKRKHGG
jgi:HEAT repeat protein